MIIQNIAHFEDIEFHLKKALEKARESVKICVAWINLSGYNNTFKELISRGVSVEIMYNDDVLNKKNFVSPEKSIQLYPVKGRFYNSLMHNKFCIIDNKIIITGSFNWSRRAFKHFENIVIIENDFRLIKNFLHEFEDLKNYYSEHNKQQKIFCINNKDTQCRSASYNIGILGSESGLHNESLVDVWNICINHEHVNFVCDQYEYHLHSCLGLNDYDDEEDHDFLYDKNSMLNDFKKERDQILKLQNYFKHSQGHKIHAIGVVKIDNPHEHIEWGEEPDYVISVLWRDMYYRKIIPDILYDGFKDIGRIIDRHV
jgi:hypothetical protein